MMLAGLPVPDQAVEELAERMGHTKARVPVLLWRCGLRVVSPVDTPANPLID